MVLKRSCVLCGNRNNLFSFPKQTHMQRKWFKAVGLKPDHVLTTTNKVCGSHFTPHQFKHTSGKRLKDDACPSKLVNNELCTTEENEEADNKNKKMCVICGFVSTKSHFRFPKKNVRVREQWANFSDISEDQIKPYDRLCDKHFASEDYETLTPRKSLKPTSVPTLLPKFKSSQNDNSEFRMINLNVSTTDKGLVSIVSTPTMSEKDLENVICVEDVRGAVPTVPKRYFRFFGDIADDDVVFPETAQLALKMGRQEIEKYRKKTKGLQTENMRLKKRCSRLEDTVTELQKKIRLLSDP